MGISIMVMARVAVWSKRAFRQPGIAKWQAFNVDEEHIFSCSGVHEVGGVQSRYKPRHVHR